MGYRVYSDHVCLAASAAEHIAHMRPRFTCTGLPPPPGVEDVPIVKQSSLEPTGLTSPADDI